MAFYYYFNPNLTSLPPADSFQTYLPNFASLFSNNEEFSNGSFYSWNWLQNEPKPQNEGLMTAATSNPAEEPAHTSLVNSDSFPKKRRT